MKDHETFPHGIRPVSIGLLGTAGSVFGYELGLGSSPLRLPETFRQAPGPLLPPPQEGSQGEAITAVHPGQ